MESERIVFSFVVRMAVLVLVLVIVSADSEVVSNDDGCGECGTPLVDGL